VTAFFEMGGYAAFVWPSLGLTAAIIGGLLVATLRQLRQRQRRLAELEAAGAQRRRRAAPESTSTAREPREVRR
jgi:heme exporter protein D